MKVWASAARGFGVSGKHDLAAEIHQNAPVEKVGFVRNKSEDVRIQSPLVSIKNISGFHYPNIGIITHWMSHDFSNISAQQKSGYITLELLVRAHLRRDLLGDSLWKSLPVVPHLRQMRKFQDRTPTGEFGCCGSRMAERSH